MENNMSQALIATTLPHAASSSQLIQTAPPPNQGQLELISNVNITNTNVDVIVLLKENNDCLNKKNDELMRTIFSQDGHIKDLMKSVNDLMTEIKTYKTTIELNHKTISDQQTLILAQQTTIATMRAELNLEWAQTLSDSEKRNEKRIADFVDLLTSNKTKLGLQNT